MYDSILRFYHESTLSVGILPKWLFFVSFLSIFNAVQNYQTMKFTSQIYCGPSGDPAKSPATPLSARTFGTWTLASAVVRLYASTNLNDPILYSMAMWIFGIAFFHFTTEWLVFGTCRWSKALASPMIVSTSSLIWMWLQRDFYVGS